jgi:hypothetical protein
MQNTPPTLEIRLLEKSLTVQEERMLLRPEGFPGLDHSLEEGAEDRPHLAPALAGGPTERPRVLGAEHRRVSVVVDRDELRTPEEDHLGPGR